MLSIEFARSFAPRPQISHVIFDFDGTVSWLRHGWPGIMTRLFREHLALNPGERETDLDELLINDILSLNGKPSIHQMLKLADRARERNQTAPDPERLLQEYERRLDDVIDERSRKLAQTGTMPDEFVVHGARPLLKKLRRRGLTLIILSGTVEHRVREEAQLLGLAGYFGSHIYGSGGADFSKKGVIDRLLREETIEGEQLLSFGDGPVEISNTREIGGRAIGVASDENENGSGRVDPWKRKQLLEAGADAVIADYRAPDELLKIIFGP